jgi:hypothetical protein
MKSPSIRVISLVAFSLCVAGCPKPESDTSSSGSTGAPGIGAHVKRGGEKRSLENDIRQLATFLFDPEKGRTPKNWQAFQPELRQAPHIARAIEDKEIIVLWDVPLTSTSIVAYEVTPDLRGNHVVARGDGSVATMATADLQTALKAMGR